MSNREKLVKEIIHEFALLSIKITSNNKAGMTDINVVSESFVASLLNEIFGYNLECSTTVNRVAIDLEDSINRIAVQVTSQKSKPKIQNTLNGFIDNKLIDSFDEIYIFILGEKQKKYSGLILPESLNFDAKQHIIDFDSLILCLKTSTITKLQKIKELFNNEFYKVEIRKPLKSKSQVKEEVKLKQKIENKLLRGLDYEGRSIAVFEPVVKFKYRDIVVRSALDFAFPQEDDVTTNGSSTWFKAGLYDFYNNGIELQAYGSQYIIFDNENHWDTVEHDEYKRIEKYKKVKYSMYLRIPYSQIIELDMNTDPFYGLPTLRVNYNNRHEPFEEIVYGLPGNFNKETKRVLLTNDMKTKLI